jgi:stage II sporulation protein AA (anti-sigma F factor antagonist)
VVALLEIRSEKAGDVLVVEVSGELDLDTSREFRSRVDAEIDRHGTRDLVLDFSGVGFVDSSGLGALLGRYKKVSERGGRVALTAFTPHVGRLLELSGVMRIIRTYPSPGEALRDLGGAEPVGRGRGR